MLILTYFKTFEKPCCLQKYERVNTVLSIGFSKKIKILWFEFFSTGITIEFLSLRPDIHFKASHPFYFALKSGSSTLFMGRVKKF